MTYCVMRVCVTTFCCWTNGQIKGKIKDPGFKTLLTRCDENKPKSIQRHRPTTDLDVSRITRRPDLPDLTSEYTECQWWSTVDVQFDPVAVLLTLKSVPDFGKPTSQTPISHKSVSSMTKGTLSLSSHRPSLTHRRILSHSLQCIVTDTRKIKTFCCVCKDLSSPSPKSKWENYPTLFWCNILSYSLPFEYVGRWQKPFMLDNVPYVDFYLTWNNINIGSVLGRLRDWPNFIILHRPPSINNGGDSKYVYIHGVICRRRLNGRFPGTVDVGAHIVLKVWKIKNDQTSSTLQRMTLKLPVKILLIILSVENYTNTK